MSVGKKGGCWLHTDTIKLNLNGTSALLKHHLVAKGYSQNMERADYHETSIAKIAFLCLLISLATACHWPLQQLDGKSFFFFIVL